MARTKFFKLGAVGVLFTLFAGVAGAAPSFCPGTKLNGSPGILSTSDVTFNTVAANDCFGEVNLANQNPNTIRDYANTNNLWTPGPWDFLVRDDSTSGNSGAVTYNGYDFILAAENGNNGNPPADWSLTVVGTPTPFQMDFLVYLHGGNNGAYYYFDDRQINASNSGTFSIQFTNNGGNFPGLSGLSLLARDLTTNGGTGVPEPATLGLIGLALAAAGFTRRHRRA